MRTINIGGTDFELGTTMYEGGEIYLEAHYEDSNGDQVILEEKLGLLKGKDEKEVIELTQKGLLALEQQVHEVVSGQDLVYDSERPDKFVSQVVQFGLPAGKEGILDQLVDVQ